jgi:hypothetical protein
LKESELIVSILHKLKKTALTAFLRDQRLPELFKSREFRLSEEFLRREFLAQAVDEEITALHFAVHDGYAEIRGAVKKRLMPQISFSFKLRVAGIEFNAMAKRLHLTIDDIKPLDLEWITRRLVERVPFFSYSAGRISIDLEGVPRLAVPLGYRIKGVRVADYFTIKELQLRPGEVVGRLGVSL